MPMGRQRTISVCLSSLALALAVLGATRAEAAAVCGQTITVDTTLTANLSCQGDGIVIGAPNVTLDLGGYTITGDGELRDSGVNNEAGHAGVKITNGAVTGFGEGVLLTRAAANRVTGLQASGNHLGVVLDSSSNNVLKRIEATKNLIDGIFLVRSSHNKLVRNAINDNEDHGILLLGSTRNLLKRNKTNRNLEGIDVKSTEAEGESSRNRIQKNRAIGNSDEGIELTGSDRNTVRANKASVNGGYGFLVVGPAVANKLKRNKATHNERDGIVVGPEGDKTRLSGNRARKNRGDGIEVSTASSRLARNRATANKALGIRAVPGVHDDGGNRAARNGDSRECVQVDC